MHDASSHLTEMRARCVKAIADVDQRADGTYLQIQVYTALYHRI